MEQNWLSALWNRFFARDGEAAAQSQSNTTSGFPRQLPPAPRHVRASWRIRAAHLVLAVNMLCVVIMTGDFTWRLAFALSYLELSATITGGNCHHGHSLTYQYSFAGRTFTGADFVSKVIYEDNLIAGQLTSVRYFSLGPFSGANLSLADRPWSADHMLFDIFYVIFGAFVSGLLWRADRRTMELVRSGHVAVGTVIDS
jgi:hypothetical protein